MQEPSAKMRGMLAGKIAIDYRSGSFNPSEMAIANDIFRILLKDIEKKVRQSLAEQLLALLGAAPAVLLHPPEQIREVAVAFPLGVLGVLLEPPHVLETEMRDRDQVVVLVLRPALRCRCRRHPHPSGLVTMLPAPPIPRSGRRHTSAIVVTERRPVVEAP